MSNPTRQSARALPGGRVPDAIVGDLAAHARQISLAMAYESLLDTVWQCERFEREHPFTCATIRSLAPRRKRS